MHSELEHSELLAMNQLGEAIRADAWREAEQTALLQEQNRARRDTKVAQRITLATAVIGLFGAYVPNLA